MADDFDWKLVSDNIGKEIGAVGFLGDKIVAIVSFYEDRDWNEDHSLSITERIGGVLPIFGREGRALTKVAFMAYGNEPHIAMRDPTIRSMAGNLLVHYARGMIADAIYMLYFSPGVKMAGRGIARVVTSGMIKQIVIRKGFEAAAKEAFGAVTGT